MEIGDPRESQMTYQLPSIKIHTLNITNKYKRYFIQ